MHTLFSLLIILILALFSSRSEIGAQVLPLYAPGSADVGLPDTAEAKKLSSALTPDNIPLGLPKLGDPNQIQYILAAGESGLYRINGQNLPIPVWTESRVSQILRVQDKTGEKWFLRTGIGLFTSRDLQNFQRCDEKIPMVKLKTYENNEVRTINQPQDFKDLAVHPEDSAIMVTATKNVVYLSKDGGRTWKDLGYGSETGGTKAVAAANMPAPTQDDPNRTELVVFLAHALSGLAYIRPDDPKPSWRTISSGLVTLPGQGMPGEVSAILPVVTRDEQGSLRRVMYLAQTFTPIIYTLNWEDKRAEEIYRGDIALDTIDSLCWSGSNILFTTPGGLSMFNPQSRTVTGMPSEARHWLRALRSLPSQPNSMYIPKNMSGFANSLVLNELWMLSPQKVESPYAVTAGNKKSVYMPANRAATREGIAEYIDLVQKNRLNSIVIDMKDDRGLLRYDSQDKELLEKSRKSIYAADLNSFVAAFKAENIYLIARVVVFKDPTLASYGGAKYAVWDQKTGKPWLGIKNYTNGTAEYYDEHWVDPYCEEVWEYNVRIARELIDRGFDEIQFDYIRFPTDGYNLYQAHYRWRLAGMDRDSAIMSFLKYARANIDAPIGIDIYGNNGWYRAGALTGQDVEMLANYVDVICPMFYPSHFEQSFLSQAPTEERPYRIYSIGTYRNTIIARNKVIIRPWVQAFQMSVKWDIQHYNKDYVLAEIFGVRDSLNRGYMYWNNSGNYSTISPDISDTDPYPDILSGLAPAVRDGSAFRRQGTSAETAENLAGITRAL
jgi:hypothetical protein